jgi:hypothetical protein
LSFTSSKERDLKVFHYFTRVWRAMKSFASVEAPLTPDPAALNSFVGTGTVLTGA